MRKVVSSLDFQGTSAIKNLPDGVAASDPVTMQQLQSAVEGLSWKDSVRVAASVNVNLAAPGAAIDGVSMAANDRVLLPAQTTASQNGIYIWNGSGVPMTRALDASTFAELESAVVSVEEGTSAGSSFRQSAVNGVIDTDAVNWATFGSSTPAASTSTAGVIALATQAEVDAGTVTNKAVTPKTLKDSSLLLKRTAANIGDGSANTFLINHNFNTYDVMVGVYLNSGTRDEVLADIKRNSVNQVQIGPLDSIISANAYRVVILA